MSGSYERSFTIVVPEGNGYNDPAAVQRIVDHFKQLRLNAEFVAKDGVPVTDDHGAYTLVTHDEKAASLAPFVLDKHYGLVPIPN